MRQNTQNKDNSFRGQLQVRFSSAMTAFAHLVSVRRGHTGRRVQMINLITKPARHLSSQLHFYTFTKRRLCTLMQCDVTHKQH